MNLGVFGVEDAVPAVEDIDSTLSAFVRGPDYKVLYSVSVQVPFAVQAVPEQSALQLIKEVLGVTAGSKVVPSETTKR